ncbi:MAG TPA: type II toxin-antitoxin system VapC family toxin [Dehalococcoidia bacterium]|nr:type II toxin-antitoxin system VapC family toxin [Dehalococcoidia bacterium]
MPGKVVDASVPAAVIFGEPRSAESLSLMAGADLYAPLLLLYELANTARKKIVQYPDQADGLIQAFELAQGLEIRRVDVDHPQVVSLALDTGLTAYDASYLQVAQQLDLPLVTFDANLTGLR